MNDWELWLSVVAPGESARSIASQIGHTSSSFSRWQRSGRPPADVVTKVARMYDASILDGLVASGWLTGDTSAAIAVQVLEGVPTLALVNEFQRRVRLHQESLVADEWLDGMIGAPGAG